MVNSETYNEIVGDLVKSIDEAELFSKDSMIACATNGHSPIALELNDLGYKNASEIRSTKSFDGKCDVLIAKVSDTDLIKLMNVTDEKTKVLIMYNRLFTAETAEKMMKYFIKNVGNSVTVVENGKNTPFDNRVFVYDFTK